MAPIDIIIDIINRKTNEVNERNDLDLNYKQGMIDAYEELVNEFEGFKRLFN